MASRTIEPSNPKVRTSPRQLQIDETLKTVRETGLRYPAGRLACVFILCAVRPLVAARFVPEKIEAGQLYQVVADWLYIIACSKSLLHHNTSMPSIQADVVHIVTDKRDTPDPPRDYLMKRIVKRDRGECYTSIPSATTVV